MKKTYDSKFKSRVALEAMRGELTIAEIASKYQIHPNQVGAEIRGHQAQELRFSASASQRRPKLRELL